MFVFTDDIAGLQPVAAVSNPSVDPVSPAYAGLIGHAEDEVFGGGEFIYLQGAAGVVVGSVVTYNGLTGAVTPLATGAIGGQPVAVAMAAIPAGSWGWFQIYGVARMLTTGAIGNNLPVVATATPGAVAAGAAAAPPPAAGQLSNGITRLASAAGALAAVQISRPMVN